MQNRYLFILAMIVLIAGVSISMATGQNSGNIMILKQISDSVYFAIFPAGLIVNGVDVTNTENMTKTTDMRQDGSNITFDYSIGSGDYHYW